MNGATLVRDHYRRSPFKFWDGFWTGVSSATELQINEPIVIIYPYESLNEALSSDWGMIGNDLETATLVFDGESEKEKKEK